MYLSVWGRGRSKTRTFGCAWNLPNVCRCQDTISQQRRDSEISGKLISGMWMELACKRSRIKNWPGVLEMTPLFSLDTILFIGLFNGLKEVLKSPGSLFYWFQMDPDGSRWFLCFLMFSIFSILVLFVSCAACFMGLERSSWLHLGATRCLKQSENPKHV